MSLLLALGICVLIIFLMPSQRPHYCPYDEFDEDLKEDCSIQSVLHVYNSSDLASINLHNLLRSVPYNATYPLTPAVNVNGGVVYRIAVITDLDTESKSAIEKHTWFSYIRFGNLFLGIDRKTVKIDWDSGAPQQLKSTLSQGGRGMELSDLKVFNGELLSVDDRNGVVYKILVNEKRAVPWILLPDGSGSESKGFKGEWMTVKGRRLFIGGLGKEWTTTTGELVNFNPMWVKVVTHTGYVQHIDWRQVYIDVRAKAGIYYPGYMIHESCQWSSIHKKWFFLPRRASNFTYTETEDETRGTNYMLIADDRFSKIEVRHVGIVNPSRGFSAFQFIPGTEDTLIVALKTEEVLGNILSYITVFDINGKILVEESQLEGNYKYEGIEFI